MAKLCMNRVDHAILVYRAQRKVNHRYWLLFFSSAVFSITFRLATHWL